MPIAVVVVDEAQGSALRAPVEQIALASMTALERYSTRFTMTSAVRSSIASSIPLERDGQAVGERTTTISAPVFAAQACHTCPSVGKSSSDEDDPVAARPTGPGTEAIVDSAIETFVVIASSSASQPRELGERSLQPAPSRGRCPRTRRGRAPPSWPTRRGTRRGDRASASPTGPSDALIRYALRRTTANSSR